MAGDGGLFQLNFEKDKIKDRIYQYEKAAAQLRDLRPLWDHLQPRIVFDIHENYATEGEYGGSPWAPLTLRWLQIKEKHGWDMSIGRRTGALESSLTREGAFRKGMRKMTIRTGIRYAQYQQYGFFARGGSYVAPRRPLQFSAATERRWREMVARWTARQLGEQ